MKTESRDFWVSDLSISQYEQGQHGTCNQNLSTYKCDAAKNKITISWQVPDRVATISESQFEEAYLSEFFNIDSPTYKGMKEKLFGEKG